MSVTTHQCPASEEIIYTVARGRGPERRCALRAWVGTLILSGALSGCAIYSTYEKCGLRGCPGDAKITAEIVSQFNQSRFLEPTIQVQTMDHVVYLNGVVSSGLEIDAAGSIARQVPGVARVLNSIVVSNSR